MKKREKVTISVPATVHDWIAERVSEGGYASEGEYLRHLVREDRERHTMHDLEAKLIEGIESGPAEPMTGDDWDAVRAEVDHRVSGGRTQVG